MIPSYFFAPKTASGSIPEDIKALCRKLSEAPMRAAEFLADAKRSWQSEIDDFHRRQARGRDQLEKSREFARRIHEYEHCIRLRSKDGLEMLVDVGSGFQSPIFIRACPARLEHLAQPPFSYTYCVETRRYEYRGARVDGVRLYEEI